MLVLGRRVFIIVCPVFFISDIFDYNVYNRSIYFVFLRSYSLERKNGEAVETSWTVPLWWDIHESWVCHAEFNAKPPESPTLHKQRGLSVRNLPLPQEQGFGQWGGSEMAQ